MRIIVVAPAAPHPFGDTAGRWYFVLVSGLLAMGHDVVCLVVSGEPEDRVRESRTLLANAAGRGALTFEAFAEKATVHPIVRKLRSAVRPFSEAYHADGLRAALDRATRAGYDVLHLEQLWTGWLGMERARSVLNIHHFEVIDWERTRLRSFGEWKAYAQMVRATRAIVGRTARMRVFTSRLLDHARTLNRDATYWIVPFALDLSRYAQAPPVAEPVVGVFGSMRWEPSRSAAERLIERIWPLVKRRCPRARLLVAGWNARAVLQRYVSLPDVTIAENVPHPLDFFSRVAVMVYAPARGSGTKIKVLEAMAYGVPVVTTWEGVEGIAYTDGDNCHVAETDQDLADRAVALLEDEQARARLRKAARALVEERHAPAPVLRRMMDVYREVAKG
jgi:glycosyltransferase involved in cell wall biosynthesis